MLKICIFDDDLQDAQIAQDRIADCAASAGLA